MSRLLRVPEMSAEELWRAVYDADQEPAHALALAEEQWPAMHARPATPHDAETCRLLSLAALKLEEVNLVLAERWRTRALARFALLGWKEGVAAVFMGRAFVALAQANDDYPDGLTLDRITGSTESLEVMRELVPFAAGPASDFEVGDRSPSPKLIERFLHEKSGFFEMLLGRYEEARASYERAAQAAVGSIRGEIRVRAGLAMVDYLQDLHDGGDGAAGMASTAEVADAARNAAQHDVARAARHNVEVMKRVGRDLQAYEIL